MLPGVPIKRPVQVVAGADLILLTVRDDALPQLVAELADANVPLDGRILAHVSGRHGTAVLEPASRRGALPLALHPVMTFTGRPDDVDRIAGICFGITVCDDLRPLAETLVRDLGGEPVFIKEADRELYHAAVAIGTNHLVTLVAQAADLLATAGVPDPARLLRPILTAALENALQLGDLGLTGPIVRADTDTVTGHLDALKSASPSVLAAYVAMSRLTADRALAAGLLTPPNARRLLAVLEGVSR
jgi:predicted short-subunit dehydrogenase-like oxidoreductase (DUF2520 family)